MAAAGHARILACGATCRPPAAGFYLYPDFAPIRDALRHNGITSSSRLAAALLERHGVATLPGGAFGDPDGVLTLRLATSLLYGDAEQRHLALADDRPEALPWIAGGLDQLAAAVAALTGAHR